VTRRRRLLRRAVLVVALLAAAVALARVPTTSARGVNFEVTAQSLPLYVKAVNFLDRDLNYRQLAAEIVAGQASDREKMHAVYEWTRRHVRDQPAGFPLVDDHVWYVIVRGYGSDDQKADVFTTLLTYAGVPAYWVFIGPRPELALSLVQIDGHWRPVDVENGVIFRTPDGALATVEQLAAEPALAAQGPSDFRGLPYATFFAGFAAPQPPDVLRAEMHMPVRRTWRELRQLIGRPDREWEMRPQSRATRGGTAP
jgi:hypothetical protein